MSAVRTRLENQDRSDCIALEIAGLFERSPHGEVLTMQLAAEHILRIADDNYRRTKGKRQTWALMRKNGQEVSHTTRVKNVAALLGQMITLEPRRSRTWVLDCIEDAITYWPWGQGR